MNGAALQRHGYSVAALRALARKRLPRMLFDMVDGAAGDEITMRRNEAALAEIELAPKLLEGAPTRDQSVELFGAKLQSPVIIGPTGLAGLLWPHAELAAARAAARFGTDLLHQPRFDRDHRGDRRRDAAAKMDAGVSLQGSRPHRGIRGARGGGRLQGAHPHRRQPGCGGPRPRRSQRHDLSAALGPAQHARLHEPAGLAHADGANAAADVRQLRQADLDHRLRSPDGRAARSRCRLERRRRLAQAMARAARDQGPPASGRRARGDQPRRRRNHRLQPRRPPARRRGRDDPRAAGRGRGGRRASAGPDRWRLSPRRRRRQGAGARRARGPDRPPAPLGRRLRGRGRSVLGARPLPARDRSRARARRLGRRRQTRPEHLLSKPPEGADRLYQASAPNGY